jgi:hypothetical protein
MKAKQLALAAPPFTRACLHAVLGNHLNPPPKPFITTQHALHAPCRYCSLYSSCSWTDRVSKYEPSWTGIGENIAMTYETASGDPMAALGMWLGSSGHCSNIFSSRYNHMGTGARGRYWTQVFVTRSAYTSNPFYDGTHYRHSTRLVGWLVGWAIGLVGRFVGGMLIIVAGRLALGADRLPDLNY